MMGAAGGEASDGEYIDNLSAAHFYTGVPGGSATVNTGVDLSGSNEGMIWVKNLNASSLHLIYDTVRGGGNALYPDRNDAQGSSSDGPATFTSTGFTTGSAPSSQHISWTFKSEPGFFDVVTYTGNGSNSGTNISHNLGSVPGLIIIKQTSGSGGWVVYHRSLGHLKGIYLNSTNAAFNTTDVWNSTQPTASTFRIGGDTWVNSNGQSYVAYLFAHNETKFGNKGNRSITKCGQYTGNGSANGPDINLGWEPQFLLIKRINASEDWMLFDHMRTSRRQDMWLDDIRPNTFSANGDGAGSDSQPYLNWTSTGFKLSSNTAHTNGNGDSYIYLAIRRPDGYVGKPVTAGTQVFTPVFGSSGAPLFKTPNHYVDWSLQKNSNFASSGSATWNVISRLRSQEIINTDDNQPEGWNTYHSFDFQNGQSNFTGGSGIRFAWNWRRYAGMDVVQYTGNGTGSRNINHSLNNIPEMVVVKKLNGTGGWQTYHVGAGNTKYLYWNQNYPAQISSYPWENTTPTKSVFTVGAGAEVNENTYLYQAFLFASVEGVSKLGSYTGTGSDLTITTGFQPRFAIIKRTDSSENWFVLDTVRGWASGNDQYLSLNNTAQQSSADFGNPVATGFLVKGTSSGTNTSGGTYIYYAHA